MVHHPDLGGSREEFLRIKEAYEELTGERAPTRSGVRADGVVSAAGNVAFEPDDAPRMAPGLTVSGSHLTLTLRSLARDVRLDSIVEDPILSADVSRTVACFEVRNESDRPLPWRGRTRTSFIGDDGFMYEGSNIVSPHADKLPDRWSGSDVDVPPGLAVRAIVVAQEVPPGVEIEQVVYTQHVHDPDGDLESTERYLFEIKDRVRDSLNQLPFDDHSSE